MVKAPTLERSTKRPFISPPDCLVGLDRASSGTERAECRPARDQTVNTPSPFFQSVSLSHVTLRVRDLVGMAAFYRDLLGFQVAKEEKGCLSLSVDGREPHLFVLERSPDAVPRTRGSSGLFHAAILYPDRGALGRIARKLLAEGVAFATGDHGVSEALYLDDPEGNGIELYADRPVTVWPIPSQADDRVGMYTQAVDLDAVIQAGLAQPGPLLPPGTRLGHLHLSVVELRSSEHFYHQLLGFEVMVRSLPGALFFGRDGYHHQFGTNVWRSRTPVVEGALGLARFTLYFAQPSDFSRVAHTLATKGVEAENKLIIHDPSGIEIVITGERAGG